MVVNVQGVPGPLSVLIPATHDTCLGRRLYLSSSSVTKPEAVRHLRCTAASTASGAFPG